MKKIYVIIALIILAASFFVIKDTLFSGLKNLENHVITSYSIHYTKLYELGYKPHVIHGETRNVIGAVGDERRNNFV